MSYSYFTIPRDLYESIKIEHKLKGYGTTIAVLNELAFRVRYNGNIGGNLNIGQCFIGQLELANSLGISVDKIRTSLNVLKRLPSISLAGTERGTIITILDERIFSLPSRADPELIPSKPRITDPYITKPIKENVNKKTTKTLNLSDFKNQYSKLFSEELIDREFPICDAHWQDKNGKGASTSAFLKWLNNSLKWANEKKPKKDERLEELKSKLFAPHENKNWE